MMAKYDNLRSLTETTTDYAPILTAIANESAEANRLKRIEIRLKAIELLNQRTSINSSLDKDSPLWTVVGDMADSEEKDEA